MKGSLINSALNKRFPTHNIVSVMPTVRPTADEAELLASVRRRVARTVGIEVGYTSAADVMRRYDELLAQRQGAPSSPDANATAPAAASVPAQASFAF